MATNHPTFAPSAANVSVRLDNGRDVTIAVPADHATVNQWGAYDYVVGYRLYFGGTSIQECLGNPAERAGHRAAFKSCLRKFSRNASGLTD